MDLKLKLSREAIVISSTSLKFMLGVGAPGAMHRHAGVTLRPWGEEI